MTDAEFDRMLEELLAEYGLGLEDIREIKKPLRRTNPKAALPETGRDQKIFCLSIPHRYADVNHERSAL